MAFTFSERSLRNLQGVQPDLVRVVRAALALSPVDFAVIEGLRTIERQKELVAAGASKTMNSRHITGHAVDLGAYVDGQVDWSWPLYERIAAAMKLAAKELGVAIVCGADWTKFRDGPHFELDRKAYPPV